MSGLRQGTGGNIWRWGWASGIICWLWSSWEQRGRVEKREEWRFRWRKESTERSEDVGAIEEGSFQGRNVCSTDWWNQGCHVRWACPLTRSGQTLNLMDRRFGSAYLGWSLPSDSRLWAMGLYREGPGDISFSFWWGWCCSLTLFYLVRYCQWEML